jgi:hypothetical protein
MNARYFVVLAGCATAGSDAAAVDGHVGGADASHVGSGSGSCSQTMTDLLSNGAFDTMPAGMGWSSTPANATYPIVTSNGTVAPQSLPDKAWMGSFVSATDEMYEDVAVPMSATSLVLAGYYQVRTTETGTTVNDTAIVELTDTSGASLEPVLALDNTQPTTAWMPFTHAVTSSMGGRTIRVHFATTNNSTKATSFYFDTVSLSASVCP